MTKTIKYPQLAARLKKLRADVAVNEFAEKMGVSLVTYYRYERGETPIKEGLLRLAEIIADEYKSRKIKVSDPEKQYDLHGGWKPRSLEQITGVPEGLGMGRAVEMLARSSRPTSTPMWTSARPAVYPMPPSPASSPI